MMTHEKKRQSAFLLRLPLSLKEEAIVLAKQDGTSLNHFISLAVAERITRLQTATSDARDTEESKKR